MYMSKIGLTNFFLPHKTHTDTNGSQKSNYSALNLSVICENWKQNNKGIILPKKIKDNLIFCFKICDTQN